MERHRIYLAIPGKQFCWGTVTGIIRSTQHHIALPFNGGVGFSGTEDFNVVWTDAINCYEAGRCTHFAMLHGDIEPDPEQFWLDILLEVMDEKGAELVSAHSPIKDGRGLTSSGICNPSDPWGAFRRFTQREILEDLPDVFDNVLAGYPDRPLLHNTGCWVADLRKPIFHEVGPDGTLRTMFVFPERIVRGEDGKWRKDRESEDWAFSRDLWERGARNTWITRRVRLTHHGVASWQNWVRFGCFRRDEDTANKWQHFGTEPLALTQVLCFELGTECNLSHLHPQCPNLDLRRYGSLDTSQKLTDDAIVNCAVQAYDRLGFTGLVGFHYYNEPLVHSERMFRLIDRIKQSVPARFILWTNGTLIPEDCDSFREFNEIVISGYNAESARGSDRLTAKKIAHRSAPNVTLDDRILCRKPDDPIQSCLRPFVEFIVDAYGNTHLCCYDWQGKGTLGNVMTDDFALIAKRWFEQLPHIAGRQMSGSAPQVCRDCGYRWQKWQSHDEGICCRARAWLSSLKV